MKPEFCNKQEDIQLVFPDQENAALRVLAKLIARRHIRNQLNKSGNFPGNNFANRDSKEKSSNG